MLIPADKTLAAALPAGVLRDPSPAYTEEPRGRYHGQAGLVAAPRDTQECAAIIRACAEARVPVVPRGGGTGLVGGQVMTDGPAPLNPVDGADDSDSRHLCRGRGDDRRIGRDDAGGAAGGGG